MSLAIGNRMKPSVVEQAGQHRWGRGRGRGLKSKDSPLTLQLLPKKKQRSRSHRGKGGARCSEAAAPRPPALAWVGAGDESRAGSATLGHSSSGTKLRYFLDPETRARACHCRKHSAGAEPKGPPGVSLGGRPDSRSGGPKELGMSLALSLSPGMKLTW